MLQHSTRAERSMFENKSTSCLATQNKLLSLLPLRLFRLVSLRSLRRGPLFLLPLDCLVTLFLAIKRLKSPALCVLGCWLNTMQKFEKNKVQLVLRRVFMVPSARPFFFLQGTGVESKA